MTPLLSLHPRSPGICGGQFGLRCKMTSHNIDSPCCKCPLYWFQAIQSTWNWEACKLKLVHQWQVVCWAKIPRFCVQASKCNLFINVNIVEHSQEYSSPLLARPRRNWLRCAKVLSMQRIFLRGHKYFPHSNTASSFTCAPPPASSSEQPAWH